MGYRSLRHRGDGEVIEEHELPYLNTIEALIYLAKYVRPDTIVFGNLLRVQFPERYKVCVRNILGYIQGVLINFIRKIKMGPWFDILIVANYLIPQCHIKDWVCWKSTLKEVFRIDSKRVLPVIILFHLKHQKMWMTS